MKMTIALKAYCRAAEHYLAQDGGQLFQSVHVERVPGPVSIFLPTQYPGVDQYLQVVADRGLA